MNVRTLRFFTLALALTVSAGFAVPQGAGAANLTVTRATLSNGLRVIVVHNPLAPVVTAEMNYKVGSDDQPIDGLAHATEHMMFRGSKTLSADALINTMDITGGDYDAETDNEVTKYFFTVPSQYLDLALRAERSRATGVLMLPSQWKNERLAITQEVTLDNSNALYRLFDKMQARMLAGTPYAKNGLGTVFGFEHVVNSTNLLKFYNTWYHPNNAVYVIVGDVDGPATIAKVRRLFGDVPAAPLPKRAPVKLAPLKAVIYHDESDEPFTAVLLGYRLPGFNSPDYSAAQILGDVLNSQRGDLYALAASGKAYGTEFDVIPYPATSVGVALAAVPVSTKPEDADALVRDVIDNYRKNGVPADLVAAAKLREVSQLEFAGNSIEGLASQWSEAVAVEGLTSPDDAIAAFEKVTTADVNRVLRTYFDESKVVAAYAVPKNAGAATGGGALAKEVNAIPPSGHTALPWWAQNVLKNLRVPRQTLSPTSMVLSNGIRLIVQPENVTHTAIVTGEIANNPLVQQPAGKDGVADIAAALLPYGTTTYGRIELQAQLDKIAATTQAGTSFSLQVLSRDFDRGVELLADEELHPAFNASDFAIVQPQEVKSVADAETSPGHLTDVALADALYPFGDVERRFATVKTVGSISLDDVKAWYASAYRPDLTTIVVVGDVTPAQARATFERYFGAWKARGPKPRVYPRPVASNAPSSTVVPATGSVQSETQLVETIGLLRKDPDWANMQVANTALSSGFSSLLYLDLRETHGYVYYVSSAVNAGRVRSTFSVTYGSDPKNIIPAENQTLAILSMLQKKAIDPDLLLRAKAQLIGDVPLRQASYDGVGDSLLSYATRGLPLNQNLIDATRELHATHASVKAAMAKWLRLNGFVRVVSGPGPK